MSHGLSFSLRDEMAASPVTPLPARKRTHHLLLIWSGYTAVVDGSGTWHDVGACTDGLNMADTLVGMKIAKDPDGVLKQAKAELAAMIQARRPGQPFHFVAREHYEGVLRDYGDMLVHLPARIVIRCVRRTEVDMRRAQAGHGKDGATVIEIQA